ncbi:right-handed parallel beta-helix repeat-containing protein, partial [Candidatus Thorarchaeota archaeon]
MTCRRYLTSLLVVILVLQPLLLAITGGKLRPTFGLQHRRIASQEPGCRLNASELTPNVPVFVNSTEDFELQNWPGEGTEADPYLISELIISYSHSSPLITVQHTDAWFVIEDCILDQSGSTWALHFFNTSHAAVQFTNVNSNSGGISLVNANDTVLNYIDSMGGSSHSVRILGSTSCSVTNCMLEAGDVNCIRVDESPYLKMESCHIHSTGWVPVALLTNSNHTTLYNISESGEWYSFSVTSCHNLTIDIYESTVRYFGAEILSCPNSHLSQLSLHMYWTPLSLISCENSTLQDSRLSSKLTNDQALYATSCNNLNVSGLIVTRDTGGGIEVQHSENVRITDSESRRSYDAGITLFQCGQIWIEDVNITDSSGHGVSLSQSHDIWLQDVIIAEVADDGIYATNTANTTVKYCSITETSGNGIYSDSAENWDVRVTHLIDIGGNAVDLSNGDWAQIVLSEFLSVDGNGVVLENADDAEVFENEMQEIAETGVALDSCDRGGIHGNQILGAVTGISVSDGVNCSMCNNVLSDLQDSGFYCDSLQGLRIDGNEIDSAGRYGVYLSGTPKAIITDNEFVNSGLFLAHSTNKDDHNHTVVGNTVNGLPLLYLMDQQYETVDGTLYGEVIVFNCTDVDAFDLTVEDSTIALQIFWSSDVYVNALTSKRNYYAATAGGSENVTLEYADVVGKENSRAFSITWTNRFTLAHSSVTRCHGVNWAVVIGESDYATIWGTEFSYCTYTVIVAQSSNVTFQDDIFLHNHVY